MFCLYDPTVYIKTVLTVPGPRPGKLMTFSMCGTIMERLTEPTVFCTWCEHMSCCCFTCPDHEEWWRPKRFFEELKLSSVHKEKAKIRWKYDRNKSIFFLLLYPVNHLIAHHGGSQYRVGVNGLDEEPHWADDSFLHHMFLHHMFILSSLLRCKN